MKAQLWIHFLYTFPLFNISSSQNTQEAGTYICRSPERDCIYFMQVATLIMQNWCIYTVLSCAPCRIDISKDEFHSYTEEGFFIIRCSNRLWGGVWSDMTTEQVSGRLTWECKITENTLPKWVCVSLYTPCIPTEEPNGSQAESSEKYCEACHHKDLRPAQQADLWQFMWSIEAHLLLYGHHHGDLVSLSSGITGDSSVNWQNAEDVGQQLQQQVVRKKFRCFQKWRGRFRWWL